MQRVNIYMMTTVRGPKEKSGKYIYLMELDREGLEPATLSKKGEIQGTENGVMVKMMLDILKRLTKACNLHLYTDSAYLASALSTWLQNWWKAGWKNAKGETVSHMEEWKEIAEILVGNEITVHLKEEHSYRKWMEGELKNV